MSWILTLPSDDSADPDVVTDRLWELGTNGVALLPSSPADDTADGLQILAGFDDETAALAARAELGGSVAPVDESAWSTPEPTVIEFDDRTLSIDADRSFGHGGHPTTRLCLAALRAHPPSDRSVLDVGCGSGVLALAAAVLGASSVTAIDVDPHAIAATNANAAANGIDLVVTDTPIAEMVGPFDLVVANLLLAELEPIAADLLRVAGEYLIVSGSLEEQRVRLDAALAPSTLVEELVDGDWIAQVRRVGEAR